MHFGKFYRFHVAFVIKRLFSIEFRVFWKEKKKGIGGAKDQNGILPIFRSLLLLRILALCRERFFWPCVMTWFSMSRHGPQAKRTTRPGRAQ